MAFILAAASIGGAGSFVWTMSSLDKKYSEETNKSIAFVVAAAVIAAIVGLGMFDSYLNHKIWSDHVCSPQMTDLMKAVAIRAGMLFIAMSAAGLLGLLLIKGCVSCCALCRRGIDAMRRNPPEEMQQAGERERQQRQQEEVRQEETMPAASGFTTTTLLLVDTDGLPIGLWKGTIQSDPILSTFRRDRDQKMFYFVDKEGSVVNYTDHPSNKKGALLSGIYEPVTKQFCRFTTSNGKEKILQRSWE